MVSRLINGNVTDSGANKSDYASLPARPPRTLPRPTSSSEPGAQLAAGAYQGSGAAAAVLFADAYQGEGPPYPTSFVQPQQDDYDEEAIAAHEAQYANDDGVNYGYEDADIPAGFHYDPLAALDGEEEGPQMSMSFDAWGVSQPQADDDQAGHGARNAAIHGNEIDAVPHSDEYHSYEYGPEDLDGRQLAQFADSGRAEPRHTPLAPLNGNEIAARGARPPLHPNAKRQRHARGGPAGPNSQEISAPAYVFPVDDSGSPGGALKIQDFLQAAHESGVLSHGFIFVPGSMPR